VLDGITQVFIPAAHTFYTRKGIARPETLHPQQISKRCYSFYRPQKDGSLSQAIFTGVNETMITIEDAKPCHSIKQVVTNNLLLISKLSQVHRTILGNLKIRLPNVEHGRLIGK
jgi:hypothetical protein